MKFIVLIITMLFSHQAIATIKCQAYPDIDDTYSRFVQLAMEPVIEDGKITGYNIKKLLPDEQIEALDCIKKSINLGNWRAAYTLSNLYNSGSSNLGIEKDMYLSKEYMEIFNANKE